MITREARESIGRLTEEGNRLHGSVERMREKYRHILEMELERVDSVGADLFEELEGDFLPASIAGLQQLTGETTVAESSQPDPKAGSMSDTRVVTEKKPEPEVQDLTKTIVNIK